MRNHWDKGNDTFSLTILAHPDAEKGDLWLAFMPKNPWWRTVDDIPSSDFYYNVAIPYMIGKHNVKIEPIIKEKYTKFCRCE